MRLLKLHPDAPDSHTIVNADHISQITYVARHSNDWKIKFIGWTIGFHMIDGSWVSVLHTETTSRDEAIALRNHLAFAVKGEGSVEEIHPS